MSMTISTTGGFLKAAVAAVTVTVSLGAATLATVEPAQAGYYRHGFYHPHFRVVHRYGYGFGHPGFAYRPGFRFGYHPFVRHDVVRPFRVIRAPFYGYGYGFHHPFRHAWGHYAWHHRYVY